MCPDTQGLRFKRKYLLKLDPLRTKHTLGPKLPFASRLGLMHKGLYEKGTNTNI